MPPLIVTAAVLRREGRILITLRPEGKRDAGMWEFPGGKLEDGESPEEGLRRELREELDIEAEIGPIFAVVHHRYPWGDVLILAYEGRPLSAEIRNLQVADHRWVLPRELADHPILPADRPIIEKLLTGTAPSLSAGGHS